MTDELAETTAEPETELEPDEELEPSAIDEELEPDLEPEPEPPAEPADEAPSSQALLAALEKEEKRHKTAIAKALGVEPDAMHECPTCQAVGYTPEPITAPPDLVQDPYTETCPRCRGNGSTLSGATARALEVIPCNGCSGSGYVQKVEQPDVGAPPAFVQTYPPSPPASPTQNAEEAAALAILRAGGYTVVEPIIVPDHVPA